MRRATLAKMKSHLGKDDDECPGITRKARRSTASSDRSAKPERCSPSPETEREGAAAEACAPSGRRNYDVLIIRHKATQTVASRRAGGFYYPVDPRRLGAPMLVRLPQELEGRNQKI